MAARLIGLLIAVAIARASLAAAPVDPQRRVAAAQFKIGRGLYAKGDYAGALAAFTNGYDASPLPGFLVNIGQCHRQLGELKEAAEAYRTFLATDGIEPALRTEVEEALAEVNDALAKEAPPPAPEPVVEEAPAPTHVDEEAPPRPELVKRPPEKKRVKSWVWAIVGVGAVAIATGVTVGVILGTRSSGPSAGSLGLIDGRTP